MKILSNINVFIVFIFFVIVFCFNVRPYFETIPKPAQQIWNPSFFKITKKQVYKQNLASLNHY